MKGDAAGRRNGRDLHGLPVADQASMKATPPDAEMTR
jgi:hypothetical protein